MKNESYDEFVEKFTIPRDESVRIRRLDAQIKSNKKVFGYGILLSKSLTAEREKAEREKAERWHLSGRELKIIAGLSHK